MNPKRFQQLKLSFLSKLDKSAAGKIDPKAVAVCSALNELDNYFTTSSCSGRSLLYRGVGRKRQADEEEKEGNFERFRVSHDLIIDEDQYFDLNVDNYSSNMIQSRQSEFEENEKELGLMLGHHNAMETTNETDTLAEKFCKKETTNDDQTLWLRVEPFILHVCCNGLIAAEALITAARTVFKNVGLQSWKSKNTRRQRKLRQKGIQLVSDDDEDGKCLVAIWGDDGVDMPITVPGSNGKVFLFKDNKRWLKELINEKQKRNWNKIQRLFESITKTLPQVDTILSSRLTSSSENTYSSSENTESESEGEVHLTRSIDKRKKRKTPKRYDVIGDIAILHGSLETRNNSEIDMKQIGQEILQTNKKLRVCCIRKKPLQGVERSSSLEILAGRNRRPLITTHREFGVNYVIDVENIFFSPRMAQERLRLCSVVGREENILVLFCGCAPEVLQFAVRTECAHIVGVDSNDIAINCGKRSVRDLRGKKSKPRNPTAAARVLRLIQGDVLSVLPQLDHHIHENSECNTLEKKMMFDRIVAPRPKNKLVLANNSHENNDDDGGAIFLECIFENKLLHNGGVIHWYDFCAEDELPECQRSREFLTNICQKYNYCCEILHTGKAGTKSIAKRQFRVCIDFRIREMTKKGDLDIKNDIVIERMMATTSKLQQKND